MTRTLIALLLLSFCTVTNASDSIPVQVNSPIKIRSITASPELPNVFYGVGYRQEILRLTSFEEGWKTVFPPEQGTFVEQKALPLYTRERLKTKPSNVRNLFVHHGKAGVIYATGKIQDGLLTSYDSGDTWTQLGVGELINVEWVGFDPRDDSHLVVFDQEGHLFQTLDGGDSWNRLPGEYIRQAAVTSYNGEFSLLLLSQQREYNCSSVTTDLYVYQLFQDSLRLATSNAQEIRETRISSLVADPNDHDRFYLLGVFTECKDDYTIHMFWTKDGGRHWIKIPNNGEVQNIEQLVVTPAGDAWVIGKEGASVFNPELEKFKQVPLFNDQPFGPIPNPENLGKDYGNVIHGMVVTNSASTHIVFTTSLGLMETNDGGQTSNWLMYYGRGRPEYLHHISDAGIESDNPSPSIVPSSILADPLHSGRWYLASNNGLYRTRNDGKTWDLLTERSVEVGICVIPSTPNRLYIQSSDSLFTSPDDGISWTGHPVPTSWKRKGLDIRNLVVHQDDPSQLFVGRYISEDGGATWQEEDHGGEILYVDDYLVVRSRFQKGTSWDLDISEDGWRSWTTILRKDHDETLLLATNPSPILLGVSESFLRYSDDWGKHWKTWEFEDAELFEGLRYTELLGTSSGKSLVFYVQHRKDQAICRFDPDQNKLEFIPKPPRIGIQNMAFSRNDFIGTASLSTFIDGVVQIQPVVATKTVPIHLLQ